MKFKYFYTILLFILTIGLFSCKDSYQKLLKSDDYELKWDKAKDYYNKGDYVKAIPLFEELIGIYKGQKKVEDLYYFYPYCYYGQGNYEFAAYYFKNFVDFYPRSAKAEDARFMIAFCYYKMSPGSDLDQDNSLRAIESFQLFANTFPYSEQLEECNGLMDELRVKLEVKAYNGAKLYYNMRDYQSAAKAFNNLLIDFPETDKKEEVMFMILESYYLYADNSIRDKQKERFTEAVNAYLDFIDKFPQSESLRDAEDIYEDSSEKLALIKE